MTDAADDKFDATDADGEPPKLTNDTAVNGEDAEQGMSTGMRILSVLLGMAVIIALMYGVALTFRP